MSRLEYQRNPEEDPQQQPDDAAQHHRLALPDEESETASGRLQYVEQLLRNAPLLSVPIGFADRVVAALKGHDPDTPDYRDAMGIVIGLLLAAVIAVIALGIPVVLFLRMVLNADSPREEIETTVEEVLASLPLDSIAILPIGIVTMVGMALLVGYVYWFVRGVGQR